jgi:hypothetical protein
MVERLEDGDAVAQFGKVASAGESRGAGADDGDFLYVGGIGCVAVLLHNYAA